MKVFETEEIYENALFLFNAYEEHIGDLIEDIGSQTDKREEIIERIKNSILYDNMRQFIKNKIKKDIEYLGENITEEEIEEIVEDIMLYIDEKIIDEVDFFLSTK